jgi:hypothetical protein
VSALLSCYCQCSWLNAPHCICSSLQVRAFLRLPGDHVIPPQLRASLTRLNELWAFQESLLGHGKGLLHETFLEACIALTVRRRQEGRTDSVSSDMPPVVQGHLDALTLLLSQSFLLRRQIMATLQKTLPPRHMCLLLVVQVCLAALRGAGA